MNTIKKRALTSIAVCFMACLMFSIPVLAASNSFSKTTVKLNAIDGGVSQIAKVSSGSVLGTNPKITQVKVYLNVASVQIRLTFILENKKIYSCIMF